MVNGPPGFDRLTSGRSYVLQRNEVGDGGYRMSWDKTCLSLQEPKVEARLEGEALEAADLSGSSVPGVQMPGDRMPARGVATVV